MKDFSLNDAFVNLRKTLGPSQGKFAHMVGCSRDAVISVENRRNGVSEGMKMLVWAATGAYLRSNGKILYILTNEPYELRHYELWSNDASSMKNLAEECCEWLTMMFEAAALPGFPGLKNRVRVLDELFIQFAARTV